MKKFIKKFGMRKSKDGMKKYESNFSFKKRGCEKIR